MTIHLLRGHEDFTPKGVSHNMNVSVDSDPGSFGRWRENKFEMCSHKMVCGKMFPNFMLYMKSTNFHRFDNNP